jgi:hypothetical protein
MVGVSPQSIAALRSIYKRAQTLFKHQLWARLTSACATSSKARKTG